MRSVVVQINIGRSICRAIAVSLLTLQLFVAAQEAAPAASGLDRATCYTLLSLYGLGDARSIAKADEILDTVLPKHESPMVDAEDKFTHNAAVAFYRLHAEQLPPALQQRARWDIAARAKAIAENYYPQHKTNFHMGHTTFALLYLEAFVLGSEAIGNRAAQQHAYEAFHDFCDYTLHNGFTEFNATDYYRFDLHCLGRLATESADAVVRRRAAAFSEWLWFEAALHFWPSHGGLTGANARTYDYVVGLGGAAMVKSMSRTYVVTH
jgi:hypothetical protein